MKRLFNILVAAVVYGISCFLTAGLTFITWWRIERGGVAPEMFGWGGAFLLVGFWCFLMSIGGLIVIGIYTSLHKGQSKIVAGISAITGLSSGIIYVVITRFCDVDDFAVLFVPMIMIIIAGSTLFVCRAMYKITKKRNLHESKKK